MAFESFIIRIPAYLVIHHSYYQSITSKYFRCKVPFHKKISTLEQLINNSVSFFCTICNNKDGHLE